MVLEKLEIGAPWQLLDFDDDTRRLSYMLLLPLFDGVFATMLVSGYLKGLPSILNVAFTIFAGAGAITVVYSEAETASKARRMILKISPVIIAASMATAVLAPAFRSMLYLGRLEIVSGIAVGVIGLQIAGIEKMEKLSVPVLIGIGLLASIRPDPQIAFTLKYLVPSIATVTIALAGLYLASYLGDRICVEYMQKGGALVLLIISASLLGMNIPPEAGLVVLAASLVASLRF